MATTTRAVAVFWVVADGLVWLILKYQEAQLRFTDNGWRLQSLLHDVRRLGNIMKILQFSANIAKGFWQLSVQDRRTARNISCLSHDMWPKQGDEVCRNVNWPGIRYGHVKVTPNASKRDSRYVKRSKPGLEYGY